MLHVEDFYSRGYTVIHDKNTTFDIRGIVHAYGDYIIYIILYVHVVAIEYLLWTCSIPSTKDQPIKSLQPCIDSRSFFARGNALPLHPNEIIYINSCTTN